MTENAIRSRLPPFPRMQLTRLRVLLMLVLAVTSTGVLVWHFASAVPAPGRSSVITPGGQAVPCTYDNYIDGSTYLGKDCTTGDNKFSETTAYKLAQDENASNIKRFWEPGIWDFTAGGGATEGTINVVNVEDWGVYGSTVFKCSTASCIAWSIGNQNAADQLYHAQNVTLHDLVFDGAGLSNSACLSVTTAQNVYINHVILQNCYELGTGCLRVTNFTSNQLLNHGVYIENSQFIKCKITLSGTINGYLRGSAFIGLANGASGTKALVDFSKGDIVPTATNNLGNFCFCGNTISGWTLQAFLGFQAVSNDTIADNTVRDANSFMQTTDTAGGIYFEGITIRNNYYSSATGGLDFGYGHSVSIIQNTISFDTNVAGGSTAISIEKSQDPTVNQQPKNIAILNNEIYKWGGIGIDAGFTDGIISGNQIYDVNQANGNANSNAGISTGTNLLGVLITSNSIVSDVGSGAGQSRPINYNGGQNITITGNNLQYFNCQLYTNGCGVNIASTIDTAKSTVIIRNNPGANPYGVISTAFSNSGSVTVGLSGSTATPTAGNTYKDIGVDLCFWSSGGSISVTLKDAGGNTIATGLTTLSDTCIQVGFTINFNTFSGATETVVGL